MATKAKQTTTDETHETTIQADEAARPGESIWQKPAHAEKDKTTAATSGAARAPTDKLGLILEGDVGSIAIGVVTYTPVSGSDGPRSQRDLDALH